MKKSILFCTLFLCVTLSFSQKSNNKTIDIDSEIQGDLYQKSNPTSMLAIIIPGSGPTDRNGNQLPYLQANSYAMLAEQISDAGIDTFTYDKRILGQLKKGTIQEDKHVFDDNVDDVLLIVDHFKTLYPNIALIGHSEGALIALLAANKTSDITKVVSLQGLGQSSDIVLSNQVSQQAPRFKSYIDSIHTSIKQGNLVKDVEPMVAALYRPSVQPYLKSWFEKNPTDLAQKLVQPLLIVQGDQDMQVDLQQGELLHKAQPKSQLITIKNMNHVLKDVFNPSDNLSSYADRTLALNKELSPVIVKFLKQ